MSGRWIGMRKYLFFLLLSTSSIALANLCDGQFDHAYKLVTLGRILGHKVKGYELAILEFRWYETSRELHAIVDEYGQQRRSKFIEPFPGQLLESKTRVGDTLLIGENDISVVIDGHDYLFKLWSEKNDI